MTIREENRDLLSVPQGYYLAHCITGDFSLGAGVAKQIDEAYNMGVKLFDECSDGYSTLDETSYLGQAILIDNVFNLVIKKNPTKKAKYKRLRRSLEDVRYQLPYGVHNKLAIPKLGCGHEGLDWNEVKEIIEEVFEDSDIEILVCVPTNTYYKKYVTTLVLDKDKDLE